MRSLETLALICMILPQATCGILGNSSISDRSSNGTQIQQFFRSFSGHLKCYTCNSFICFVPYNTQTCPSGYNYCLTATILTTKYTLKTCTTQDVCDLSKAFQGLSLSNVKCCQTYLCNGAESFTQSFLLMFIPLLSSVLFY